ncbi:MAG: hypothetical protein ABI315_13825 [Bacteroidia bacterium]
MISEHTKEKKVIDDKKIIEHINTNIKIGTIFTPPNRRVWI